MRTLAAVSLVLITTVAAAEPTRVTVRAISRDAKVIGDGVGGARITIRDAATGRVLASGVQRGNTGDTKRIMQEPRTRDAVVYGTEGAAAFHASLDLDRPTNVEIVAEGPLGFPQAMQRASKRMLLVPGQHIEGEGILLEIHGLIVEITAPAEAKAGEPVAVRARVRMACGCPTEPGGMWDSNEIAVTARLLQRGRVVVEAPLRFAGQTSTYEGTIVPPAGGRYAIEVLAASPKSMNFGNARANLRVAR
ncbi:MAG TPA: hypothetical protein VNL91_09810 [Thermoanaerobaculia bacterium]|nr:hypothetical protein [Thermoanaerobaculia bacterium]